MTLKATSGAYSSQQLLEFVSQAQKQGKLSPAETTGLHSLAPTISLEQLQQKCQGHPQLEQVVQAFIKTQDQVHVSGAQSYEFGNNMVFANVQSPPLQPAEVPALKPVDERIARVSAEIERLQSRLGVHHTPSQSQEIKRQLQEFKTELSGLKQQREQMLRETEQVRSLGLLKGILTKEPGPLSERQGNTDLDVVLRNTAQADPELGRLLTTRSQEQDQLVASGLQLNTGQSFVYANLITAQAPQLHQLMHALNLVREGHAPELKPEDMNTLKSFGLYLKQGQLVNLMNKEPVSASALNSLMQTAVSLERVQKEEVGKTAPSAESQATAQLRHNMALALRHSAELTAARGQLDVKVQELDQATAVLEARTQQLSQSSQALSSATDTLAQQSQRLQSVSTAVDYLSDELAWVALADPDALPVSHRPPDIPEPVTNSTPADQASAEPGPEASPATPAKPVTRRPEPEQLAQTNSALAAFGLKIEVNAQGLPRFLIADQAVDAQTFMNQAKSHLQQEQQEVQTTLARVGELTRTVKAEENAVQEAETLVTSAQSNLAQASSDYENASSALAADNAQLAGVLADPHLPAEVRASAEPVLQALQHQSEHARAEAPALRARLQQHLDHSNRALSQSREVRETAQQTWSRAEREAKQMEGLLHALKNWLTAGLEDLLSALSHMPKNLISDQMVQEALNKLSAQVEALQERLTQTGSDPQAQQELGQDLKGLLENAQTVFKTLSQTETKAQTFQQQLTTMHLHKLHDSCSYHLHKLQDLQNHAHEQIAQQLSDTLKQLRGSLFVAQSITG